MSHASSPESTPSAQSADPAERTDPPKPSGRRFAKAKLKPPAWPTFAVLAAIALIALAVAAVGWFRLASDHEPHRFSDQQIADAKSHVCAASRTVRQAVVTNTHRMNPVPNDPIGALAVAANARLALYGGGDYLQDRVAAEPALPADLAKAVDAMADTLKELGIGYLADAPSSAQDPLRKKLDSEIQQIDALCQ